MGDVQYIVDKLNAPPFSMGLTMLSLSEKPPLELLQLLSNVFTAISRTHQAMDVAAVGLDQAVEKLLFFLRIVKYKSAMDPVSLRQALAAGERSTITTVLKWVLPQAQQLEKRAFVGYYLSFPDMPEELLYDQDVMDLREAIKGMHQDFISVHKEHDTAKAAVKDLPILKTQLKQLQEEQERLTDKVARAKQVAAGLPDADSYRELCAALRRQHDEEVSISQQLQAQRQQLERAEATYQRASGRLRDMQSSMAGQLTGEKLLAALQEDVGRMRVAVSERYPRDLQVKQQRLNSLQETLNNGVNTEVDLQRLSSQAGTLQAKIQASQERQAAAERARQGDRAYLQVRQAQQMLTLVNKKKAELAAKLQRLQEQEDSLRQQLDGSAAAAASAPGAVSDEEWRSKYETIKAQLPHYKAMKKELADLEAEGAVLARTEALLKQQEGSATATLERLERKQGITGYSDVAAGLEAVSEAKGALDEAKGAMLEEISATVTAITDSLRSRKAALAPQIQALRAVRSAHQELQAQHDKAKAEWDADVGALEAKAAAMSATLQEMQREVDGAQADVDKLEAKVAQLDEQLKQLAGGAGEAAMKASYTQQLVEAEARLRQLREQQRTIKERHYNGLQQRDMLGDLVRLLRLKMQLMQGVGTVVDGAGEEGIVAAGCGSGLAGQAFHTATANVMVL